MSVYVNLRSSSSSRYIKWYYRLKNRREVSLPYEVFTASLSLLLRKNLSHPFTHRYIFLIHVICFNPIKHNMKILQVKDIYIAIKGKYFSFLTYYYSYNFSTANIFNYFCSFDINIFIVNNNYKTFFMFLCK